MAYGCLYDYDLTTTLQPLTELQINLDICDFGLLYEEEEIDLSVYEADLRNLLTGKNITNIKYYPTLNDAHSESVSEITAYWAATIQGSSPEIFARVIIENECPIIIKMKFNQKDENLHTAISRTNRHCSNSKRYGQRHHRLTSTN